MPYSMIYLDNSATTEISAVAKAKMIEAIEVFGNPSSRHSMGIEAKKIIDRAREQVGGALGLQRPNPENLVFTSCGSESNDTAVLGCLYSKEKRRQNKIITTDSEHPSVENVMRKVEKDGFEVVVGGGKKIKITAVVPEGKGRMSAGDFVRGRRIDLGDVLKWEK